MPYLKKITPQGVSFLPRRILIRKKLFFSVKKRVFSDQKNPFFEINTPRGGNKTQ